MKQRGNWRVKSLEDGRGSWRWSGVAVLDDPLRKAPKVGSRLTTRQQGQSKEVKELSWRMQNRLHKRYVKLKACGKNENKAIVAIARKLSAFIWELQVKLNLPIPGPATPAASAQECANARGCRWNAQGSWCFWNGPSSLSYAGPSFENFRLRHELEAGREAAKALNGLAHFFKYVLGVKEPVFGVKLRDTGTRVPVVLSKPETQILFVKLQEQEEREARYELTARLQYGAGLRLSELIQNPGSGGATICMERFITR